MTGARVVDGAVILREARGDDETFLRDLYESTRDDLAAVDWPSEQLDAILALQWAAQKEGYRALHPAAQLAAPLNLGGASDTLYIELYGTGIRGASGVQCFVGDRAHLAALQ